MSMTNKERISAMYAAFGRGDIPAVLQTFSEDVDFDYTYPATEPLVPWLKRRRGRREVAQFFEALGALEFHKFVPKTILEGPEGLVVALIDLEATVKATGRRIREEDEVHIFRLDDRGQVVRFRHCVDTAQHLFAYRAG
jgi:ketosteroid isomerase-like protein